MNIKPIAKIKNDLPEKFGVPKQSGLAASFKSKIIFEPEFAIPEAIRGLEGFSHIWLIWGFSETSGKWSPTVRPPRLGGNARMGVFATRSPFRPNSLGLSSVKLESIDTAMGEITVSGADMKDGTPIYDIKPYLPEFDSHEDALSGFAAPKTPRLTVVDKNGCLEVFSEERRKALIELLSFEVRPQYHEDGKVYRMSFAQKTVEFRISGKTAEILKIR